MKLVGKSSRRWKCSKEVELGLDGLNWIDLTDDKDKWRALLYPLMNLHIP
jgi:hypothetical protein